MLHRYYSKTNTILACIYNGNNDSEILYLAGKNAYNVTRSNYYGIMPKELFIINELKEEEHVTIGNYLVFFDDHVLQLTPEMFEQTYSVIDQYRFSEVKRPEINFTAPQEVI
jgi:hypothetical protein